MRANFFLQKVAFFLLSCKIVQVNNRFLLEVAIMIREKVVLFGGTFDPVHNGHIIVAEHAAQHINADRVIFIPARRSPLKSLFPSASGDDRVSMIRLAIAGKSNFEVSSCELTRPDPGYTLDTVLCLGEVFGLEAELFWLIGADVVKDMPRWYRVDELMDRCRLCIMLRGGFDRPRLDQLERRFGTKRLERLKDAMIATPLVEVSSSEIRDRIARGEDVSGLIAPDVAEYIAKNGLYTQKTPPPVGF